MSAPGYGLTKPANGGAFPLWEDVDLLGGFQVQPTTTARDAIPFLNRKVGMWCWVTAGGGTLYQCTDVGTSSTAGTWVTLSLGGAPSGTAGGDLSGTYPNPTVAKVNGVAVSGTPATGNVLTATGTTAATWQTAPSGFTAGGDLSGTSTSQTVAKVNGIAITGTPSAGYIPIATSAAAAAWSAAPSGFTAGGDLGGTSTAQDVLKVHGASVPAAGSLANGNALYASGASSLAYSALNLAGGSAWVTGQLPLANQASQLAAVTAVTGTAAAGYNLIATGAAAAAWTAPAATPTGTGFTHYVASVRDAAAKLIDLAADVTGSLPAASVSGFAAAADARITANIPTGTGFAHITAGARDAAAVLVNLAADVTGVLAAANGGGPVTFYPGFQTTSAATVTVATSGTVATNRGIDCTASITGVDSSNGQMYSVTVTGRYVNLAGTMTSKSGPTPNDELTDMLGVSATFQSSGTTMTFVVLPKASTTINWGASVVLFLIT